MNFFNKIVILFALHLVVGVVKSQTNIDPYIVQNSLSIVSADKMGNYFEANTNACYLLLNTTTGDFSLNFDAKDLRTGSQKLDSVLINKGSQHILFKGNIADKLLLFNQQVDDEKTYAMQGQLFVNNAVIDCVAHFDPINSVHKAGAISYVMNFNLIIDASKISISGLESKLNKQILIEIKGGKLNIQQ